MKQEATALEVASLKNGTPITRCEALEQVAKTHGHASWRAARAACDVKEPDPAQVDQPVAPPQNMNKPKYEKYHVRRNGDSPIVFSGLIIGEAEINDRHRSGYYVSHTIFKTARGIYVAEYVHDLNCKPDTTMMAEKMTTPEELVAWLRNESGAFSETAQLALERAARVDDAVRLAYYQFAE